MGATLRIVHIEKISSPNNVKNAKGGTYQRRNQGKGALTYDLAGPLSPTPWIRETSQVSAWRRFS